MIRDTSLHVERGQAVRIYSGEKLVATATRYGSGWSVSCVGQLLRATNLDNALLLLNLLPDHHR